jgi:hypothetical protein
MSRDSIPDSGKMFVSCSQISHQPPCSLSPLSNGHQELFPWKCSDLGLNITIHHHLVSKLKVGGTAPPVPLIPLWCGKCQLTQVQKYEQCILLVFRSYNNYDLQPINLLEPELFFLILAHPVHKMWIIQEPNMLQLWNNLHFEEGKTDSIYHV